MLTDHPLWKQRLDMRPMKNGAKMKKDWVEEVGEKEMAAVFSYSNDRVSGAGRVFQIFSPVKVNVVVYFVVRGG